MFQHPIECHRLFFALRPPPPLASRMVETVATVDCRAMTAERMHMTMFLLADRPTVEPDLVETLRAIGNSIRAAPVAITLDRLAGSYRLVALRPARANAALLALHRALADGARAAGIAARADQRFGPHVTLGYDNPSPWSERIEPIGWTADELVLIDSLVGRTRHRLLGRWRLAGEPAKQLTLF